MKTKIIYKCKYFNINLVETGLKTNVYNIYSSNEDPVLLGSIKWYNHWRKYCFYAEDNIIWDSTCLCYIIRFLDSINLIHKNYKNINQTDLK